MSIIMCFAVAWLVLTCIGPALFNLALCGFFKPASWRVSPHHDHLNPGHPRSYRAKA